jgi:hypothetical protein
MRQLAGVCVCARACARACLCAYAYATCRTPDAHARMTHVRHYTERHMHCVCVTCIKYAARSAVRGAREVCTRRTPARPAPTGTRRIGGVRRPRRRPRRRVGVADVGRRGRAARQAHGLGGREAGADRVRIEVHAGHPSTSAAPSTSSSPRPTRGPALRRRRGSRAPGRRSTSGQGTRSRSVRQGHARLQRARPVWWRWCVRARVCVGRGGEGGGVCQRPPVAASVAGVSGLPGGSPTFLHTCEHMPAPARLRVRAWYWLAAAWPVL